ncbi:hypothetical protein AMATHDRAFT_6694 [Amanita thiersii Skay4041]|uniref:Uncharacterized protein n=1 Tax=Amanita thiersii Skay4041 TaxID=703135 RepID=A0A2A9NI98_9AGAR|nr:hypothetical protein AMATHDRAFT_6694 [Amanita thiersii Skay4041]
MRTPLTPLTATDHPVPRTYMRMKVASTAESKTDGKQQADVAYIIRWTLWLSSGIGNWRFYVEGRAAEDGTSSGPNIQPSLGIQSSSPVTSTFCNLFTPKPCYPITRGASNSYTMSTTLPTTMMEDPMAPLERLFQQIEEERERLAEIEYQINATDSMEGLTEIAVDVSRSNSTRRRGGSVSVTCFGQLAPSHSRGGTHTPSSPSAIASRLPFYQAQLANASFDSYLSADKTDDENALEEETHITQVYEVSCRNSLSKAMSEFLPRRLSRSLSTQIVPSATKETSVVIGVSVEEATVEVTDGDSEELTRATVHAPNSTRNRTSRLTLSGSNVTRPAWVTKAKDITEKVRRRSKTLFSTSSAGPVVAS